MEWRYRSVANYIDSRAKSEYSFGKLLNSAHVLSAKYFGIEEKRKIDVESITAL